MSCSSPSTKLFNTEKDELISVPLPNKKDSLKILYVSGNATTQNCIQVITVRGKEIKVLRNYERYNSLDYYDFSGDSILTLVLRDTLSYLGNKPDMK